MDLRIQEKLITNLLINLSKSTDKKVSSIFLFKYANYYHNIPWSNNSIKICQFIDKNIDYIKIPSILIAPNAKESIDFILKKLNNILNKNVSMLIVDNTSYQNNIKLIKGEIDWSVENNKFEYYIERVDPFKFLEENTEKEYLVYYIKVSLEKYSIFLTSLDTYKLIIKNTTFIMDNFQDNIQYDINLLISRRILTSRLAIVIYRLSYFDIKATATTIGRYFAKKIGSKSKTMNSKDYPGLLHSDYKTNFKAYNLDIDESELRLKKEIARNLIKLNIKKLDTKTIAEATKLPIETIIKIKLHYC